MDVLKRCAVLLLLGVLCDSEDIAERAGVLFSKAQASHQRGLQSSVQLLFAVEYLYIPLPFPNQKAGADFAEAVAGYGAVLDLVGDHAATRYFLGTCLLDWGRDMRAGVAHIEVF